MKAHAGSVRILAGVLAATLPLGCGWSRGLVLPEGARSVGVEIFRVDRGVFERGLEAELHDELSRAVSDLGRAPLAAPHEADLILRGQITDYRRRGGIRNRQNRLLESAVQIEIRAELVSRREAGLSRNGSNAVEASSPPSPSSPSSPSSLGAPATTARVWSGYALDDPRDELSAQRRALRYLAETIVLELFADPLGPQGGEDVEPADGAGEVSRGPLMGPSPEKGAVAGLEGS